ncbi:MAG: TonB-dependent receptor, partial [Spirochaetia bacterium]|nr:TonB-dependent receptor [Spirochaetia bacterium]
MKILSKLTLLLLLAFFAAASAQEQKTEPQTETNEESGTQKATTDAPGESKEAVVEQELDEVSITATRGKRKTQDVPASVEVISAEEIEDTKMRNVKDALTGTAGVQIDSKNGGYDSRFVIRGAGAKAAYGIREIMILINGVPVTDPDGFSKLDMLDPLQIESIEVVKGPNSTLWGANSAGGVVNIMTKDPIKNTGGFVRTSGGNGGDYDVGISYGSYWGDSFLYSASASYVKSDNSWRERNKFSAYSFTFQPSFVSKDGSTWQNYISFNRSDVQLPGSLSEELFEEYKQTGKSPETDSLWRRSGRYADSFFVNTRYNKEIGSFTLKPMAFYTRWTHYHPVTSFIGVSKAHTGGFDLQIDQKHKFGSVDGTLTFGGTMRIDDQHGDKYKYKDIDWTADTTYGGLPLEKIDLIHTDANGEKASVSSSVTTLAGLYAQESINPMKNLTVDMGIRYDFIRFDKKEIITTYYDWAKGGYVECTATMTDCGGTVENNRHNNRKDFMEMSPRGALSYRIVKPLSFFASIARGIQTPTDGEVSDNPDLDIVTSTNYETGLKGRGKSWDFDMSVYYNLLENEVVTILDSSGDSHYENAGKTKKMGFEFSGSYNITKPLYLGGTFTYNDFRYKEFAEILRNPSTGQSEEVSRNGNHMVYSPK